MAAVAPGGGGGRQRQNQRLPPEVNRIVYVK